MMVQVHPRCENGEGASPVWGVFEQVHVRYIVRKNTDFYGVQ
jgi:hypothetical protein